MLEQTISMNGFHFHFQETLLRKVLNRAKFYMHKEQGLVDLFDLRKTLCTPMAHTSIS